MNTEIRRLVVALKRYDEHYHLKGTPVIPDSVYDAIYNRLMKLELDYPDQIYPDSPTQTVGAIELDSIESQSKPTANKFGITKVKHSTPMTSLSNTYTQQDTCDWFIKSNAILYANEPKIDGIAISLTYSKGVLTQALTRGNGVYGYDILQQASQITDIPLILNTPVTITVRGEIFFPKEALKTYNEQNPQNTFSNARNAVAGIIKKQNSPLISTLGFFTHTIESTSDNESQIEIDLPDSYFQCMQLLKSWGLPIIPQLTTSVPENCPLYYTSMLQHRDLLPFDIDGVVFKVDSRALQHELGFTSRAPKWAIAFKFPAHELPSQIINIDYQLGRTGVITPVARIQPIHLCGVEVSNVTLHNFDYIQEHDCRIGDTVIVKRAGDVIPDIVKVLPELRPLQSCEIVAPPFCPCCGATTLKKGAFLYCTGDNCKDTLVAKLAHYVHKNALDMAGLGIELMRQLVYKELVKNFSDLYNLTRDQLCTLKGITSKSAQKILHSIETSKGTTLECFLYGLGIDQIGRSISNDIARQTSLDAILEGNFTNLDIGESRLESLKSWFSNNSNLGMVHSIISSGVHFKAPISTTTKLANLSFVITGKFSLTRNQIQDLIISNGGTISNTVKKTTSFLICGGDSGSKESMAKKYGVKIITLQDLTDLLT